jgi:hypothetical protein
MEIVEDKAEANRDTVERLGTGDWGLGIRD